MPAAETLSESDVEILRRRLKLHPRHVTRVVRRDRAGAPQVIEYYPLSLNRDGSIKAPYPTLYWLTCPRIIRRLAVLEYEGWIRRLQGMMRDDDAMRAAYHDSHRQYVERRWAALTPEHRDEIVARGWGKFYLENGIGGIAGWDYVKCLHLHFAHHLAGDNVLGAWVAENLDVEI